MTVLKGTMITLILRENPDNPVRFLTALPIEKICAQIEDEEHNEEDKGSWIWRIDQIPFEEFPSGFIFYVQWESIQSVTLQEYVIADLDLEYNPPQADNPDSGPDDQGGDGNKVVNFHGPRKPPPGGATRKPHVRAPSQGLVT